MTIKLSICIPTYNRAIFIDKTIESIILQATDEIEIVISDNGSTDNTKEIVTKFQQQFPRIRYFAWEQNMGFDRNVIKVCELATGEYCWFLGSDDRIETNGIRNVLEALNTYPELGGMCLGFMPYDKEMLRKGVLWNPTLGKYRQVKLFENAEECFSILGHYFGFFSAQVINRKAWMEVSLTGEWEQFCHGFVHVYMVGKVLAKIPRWLFLPSECVAWRSGNDDLLTAIGFYERIRFDIVRYEEVVRALLSKKSSAYRATMKIGVSVHITRSLIHAKLNNIDLVSLVKVAKLCIKYYADYPTFWLKTFPVLVAPNFFIKAMRRIYQSTWKRVVKAI